ncbi:MAG TPA: hypothetical protein VD793_05965, partial [Gemmatimonadales bacterium]|nr:hypothetical protein [Gemmatimonadales bacterium]
AAPQRTLVIGGQVERGRRIRLRPAFVLTARPAVPEGGGPYRLEGLGRDGQRLFAYGFDPARLDHASDVRHFTFAIPIAQASDALLREIRVSGPEGEDRLGQLEPRRAAEAQPAPVAPLAVAARGGDGLVTVTCTAGAQGALVLDGPDGAILGMASGPTVRIVAPPASPLTVVCSGGVHSVRTAVVAP